MLIVDGWRFFSTARSSRRPLLTLLFGAHYLREPGVEFGEFYAWCCSAAPA